MELLDPRLAGIAAVGAALVGSERVRKTVGRGVGYAASGVATVGGPVVRPVLNAGRDIVDEARDVASHDGTTRSRPRSSRARTSK
jgi:hypothetical protein